MNLYILFRPTFIFYKNEIEITRIIGADQEELINLVEQHAGTPEKSESKCLNIQGHVSQLCVIYSFCFSLIFHLLIFL